MGWSTDSDGVGLTLKVVLHGVRSGDGSGGMLSSHLGVYTTEGTEGSVDGCSSETSEAELASEVVSL